MKKFVAAFLCICSLSASAQDQKYAKVKIFCHSHELPALFSLGIPNEGIMKKDTWFITELSQDDINKVRSAGFQTEILIADMTKYYADRNVHPEKYSQATKQIYCTGTPAITTPAHFVLGSMGGFYLYNEMLAQLDSMRVHFPNLISVRQQIGTLQTIEGRPMYWVRISDNADTDEGEPEVLYSALNHAREPMGMQALIFYMWYLLENYGTNAEVTTLLDNTEMYFVPCVNIDGYIYNQTTNPSGGGMWRKNRRDNGGSYGVDLNRNYGNHWGWDNSGSSPNPSDETYRGTSGFSEPETQIMKWFGEHRQFRTAIDYHCYGNYLLYPWAYFNSKTPDSVLYDACSNLMVQTNGYAAGTPMMTLNYNANGGSVDWYYGEQTSKNKIIAWSPEAGDGVDGFWPASNRIEDIAKVNIEQNLYVARFAGRYAATKELNPRLISQLSDYFVFSIQRLGMDTAFFTVTLIPVSSNVLSAGPAKLFGSLNMLESRTDSIAFALSPGIQQGEEIVFVLQTNNGMYMVNDTIRKVYGTPVVIFSDNGSSMTNWSAGGWAITSSQYHSAPSSITDSPSGNYGNNQNKSVTLTGTVDLANKVFAQLNFWARWNIEDGYDYVQLTASADGGSTWTPLCGKYTNAGSADQLLNEPLYDGVQSSWVKEEIDLGDFLGDSVKFRFTLKSDTYLTYDGFYFDDMEVLAIAQNTSGMDGRGMQTGFYGASPNPATQTVLFAYDIPAGQDACIILYNALGQPLLSIPLDTRENSEYVDVSAYPAGVYIAVMKCGYEAIARRLVIAR